MKIERAKPIQRKKRLIRSKIASKGDRSRLTIHRTVKHIYAQVFTADGAEVLASASSVDKEIKGKDFGKGRLKLAGEIGKLVAKRAKEKGVDKVAFDRAGRKYHGCIKALADGAREVGLDF